MNFISDLLTSLRKSSFFRNILVVMSGTATAQVVGFALSPVISRLFSPSDFGVFGSFGSVSSIIAAGVTLEYSQAMMLPKEKEDAFNLFVISCLCTVAIGLACITSCLVAPEMMNGLMKTDGNWAQALLVAAIFVTGLNQSCQAWCVRAKAFKQTSASQVIRGLSSNGMQIGFGYLKTGAPGLIMSTVLADMAASLNLVRVLLSDLSALRESVSWTRMKQLAKEYLDFPMYSASQNVINALSAGLPVLLLAHFFGIVVAGAYAFGMRILQVPMGFVLTALRQVLFQRASEILHQGGNLVRLYVNITGGLFVLAALPTLVLFIWAPQLFTWVFGSQWETAGEFARYLVFWMMFVFCNLPAVLYARIIRIQKKVFLYNLVLLSLRILALIVGGLYLNATLTIILFSGVGATMNLFLIVLVGHALTKADGQTNYKLFRDSLVNG